MASRSAAVVVLALGVSAIGRTQDTPTFPARVELIQVDVVVLDRDGKPVPGLSRDDFEVVEDGRVRPISSFEPVVVRQPTATPAPPAGPLTVTESKAAQLDEGRYFLIFFDDVHIGAVNSEFVRQSLRSFLEHDVRDGDWVTIVSPLAGVWWTARTPWEHQQLPAIVERLKGKLTRPEAIGAYAAMNKIERPYWNNPGGGMHEMGNLGRQGGGNVGDIGSNVNTQALYATVKHLIRQSLGSLQQAVDALAAFRGHKTLLFYSQGFVLAPGMGDFDRVIDLARRHNVVVDLVDAAGLRSGLPGADADSTVAACNPTMCFETEEAGAARIAYDTGGRAVVTNDFVAPLRMALDQSMAYYLLGYEPVAGQDDRERHVKIQVRRKGLTAQTRTRYLPGADKDADPPDQRALHSVFDATDLPLRVGTFFLGPSPQGGVETTLAVEVKPGPALAPESALKLTVEIRPRDGRELLGGQGQFAFGGVAALKAALAPGIWQARFVVSDPRTGRVGSALHTFEVPPSSGFRMSTPVVTDGLEPDGSPKLRLDPTFSEGSTLYCRYEVFGASRDGGTGGLRVVRSYLLEQDGRPVTAGDPAQVEPTTDGRLLGAFDLALAGFAPGGYTLVSRVSDEVSGESRETRSPVDLVRP